MAKKAIASITPAQVQQVRAHFHAGRIDSALTLARQLEKKAPNHPELIDVIGACLRRTGQIEAAIQIYERGLMIHDTAELWSAKGQALMQTGRPSRAAAALSRASALAPKSTDVWRCLAQCYFDTGQFEDAKAAVSKALAIAPGDAPSLVLHGRLALTSGDADAAQSAFRDALEADPDNPQTLNELAILARAMGQRDRAETHYTTALKGHPDNPVLLRNQSEIAVFDGENDPKILHMQRLLDTPSTPPAACAQLHFGLFNAFDQIDDTDRAFQHLHQANALRRQELGYDVARDATLFGWLKTLDLPQAEMGNPKVTPIFVTGLPRSGTTLAEHMLSQGDGVRPAGELAVVKSAIAPVLRTLQTEARHRLNREEVLDLQRRLRDRLNEHSGGFARIIDKMPLNFRWVGFLRAALPEARIIVMSRDPMALGWSLYRQCFGGNGNAFAYNLGDIACFQAITADLTRHWHAEDSAQIIPLKYADLTANPAQVARRLRADCGIPEASGPDAGHVINRPILTASADQVRRPVDARRDDQWRRYARHLEPMQSALAQFDLHPSERPPQRDLSEQN